MRLLRDIFTILKVLADNLHEVVSCQTCPFAREVNYNSRFNRGAINGCIAASNESFFNITGDPKYHALVPDIIPDQCPNKNSGIVYIWQ